MNKNKKGTMPSITREVYKGVKKYDRQQFTEFCANLYKCGFEDGVASVPGTDVKQIYEVIAGTKGIGPKKLEAIMESIEAILGGKKEDCNG